MTGRILEELELLERGHGVKLLYVCESGSRAWGFASPDSDYDVRFIYVQPSNNYVSIRERRDVIERPVDAVLDIGGWDLRKALQFFLLACEWILERGGAPPMHGGTVLLSDWLASKGYKQNDCGLVKLDHFRDAYLIYNEVGKYAGIVSDAEANDVRLSEVERGMQAEAVLYFNKDAYSTYCQEYASYWEWVADRNEVRYKGTIAHGRSYDAKHMMHTFRLLNMAEEIALHKRVLVHREDRAFLLRVKAGEFEYEELVKRVEEKMDAIKAAYAVADLPEASDSVHAEEMLVGIRREFYR